MDRDTTNLDTVEKTTAELKAELMGWQLLAMSEGWRSVDLYQKVAPIYAELDYRKLCNKRQVRNFTNAKAVGSKRGNK